MTSPSHLGSLLGVLILLLPAGPSHSEMVPPRHPVSDRGAVGLLKEAYGEPASLSRNWNAEHREAGGPPLKVSRRVCLDSGADARGLRWIAVCGRILNASEETPGVIDLWVMIDAGLRHSPEIMSSRRGIRTGAAGEPGAIDWQTENTFQEIFALSSRTTVSGFDIDTRTLYGVNLGSLSQLLTVGTHLASPCLEREGASCVKRDIELRCRLRVDEKEFTGHVPTLFVDIEGHSGGRAIRRTVRIPYFENRYFVPEAALNRAGCGGAAGRNPA